MGIFFSILSSALYGANNCFDKFVLEKYEIHPTVISIYSGIMAFAVGLIVFAFTGLYSADFKSIIIILASGFLTGIYVLPYFKALSKDEASRVVPLFQFVPVFILVLSYFVFKEALHFPQYIGAGAIIGGSFLLSLKKFDRQIFKIRPAFWYMILSSFIFAVSVILYKFGVEEIPFWNTLPLEGLGIFLGALVIWLYKNNKRMFLKETRKFPKKVFVLISINEVLYIASRYTAYFALSLISASIANLLAGLQPFFVLIYGIILSLWFPRVLKEAMSERALLQKMTSMIMIFIGLYLIFFQ
jgi:drug/metabolite transporter (DMT)-like permease